MRLIPMPESVEVFSNVTGLNEITEYEKVDNLSQEEYKLIIEKDKIAVKYTYENGKFYAEKTFSQLKNLYSEIPCMNISDKPRYSHRGFMIDCARHMFSIEELKKIIDIASAVKLNKFHWHLSDDQGFRIELKSLPELTEKGSVRKCDTFLNCACDKEYSGYYTKAEIREIIAFCKERYIDVIPEFDMPGHLSAVLHVYPQLTCSGKPVEVKTRQGIFSDIICVGNQDSFTVIEKILDEIIELFPYDAIHIGGDEVPKGNWRSCEKCRKIMDKYKLRNANELQCWFTNKMVEYIRNKGKKCIVWNDSLKGSNLSEEVTVQYWMHTASETAQRANEGQKIVLSPFNPYYVDYPYGMHTLKNAYTYEPENFRNLDENGKRNIAGIESPIWTEYVTTDERLEYQCFPRWFAIAETAWCSKNNKNFNEFISACRLLCSYYEKIGLNFGREEEWYPSPLERLTKTVGFFIPKRKK